MKKLLGLFFVIASVAACNNQPATPAAVEEKPAATKDSVAEVAQPKVDYPFAATYSSDWKMGDPRNSKVVLDFYKSLVDGKFDEMKNYFGDSVQFRLYDTRSGKISTADALQRFKDFRARFKKLDEEFIAFVPIHSNDKNEDWVAAWVKERVVYPNGKIDSTTYQENWVLRQGKIAHVEGFAQYKFRH